MSERARRASAAARAGFPCSRAVSLRLRAEFPSKAIVANSGSSDGCAAPSNRVGEDSGRGGVHRLPKSKIDAPHRRAANVTAGSSQSQSTPAWTR